MSARRVTPQAEAPEGAVRLTNPNALPGSTWALADGTGYTVGEGCDVVAAPEHLEELKASGWKE